MEHFEQLESYLPIDLTIPNQWPLAALVLMGFLIFRYFLMAGGIWWLFYRLKPHWTLHRQIYARLPSGKAQWFEIRWSVATSLLFALGGLVLGILWQKGLTKIYLRFDEYPLWYMPLSLFLWSILHEVYFYVTHRLLHWPPLYKLAHQVHHQSLTPSPWASFSFHPIEGLIQAIPLPVLAMILPIHPVMLLTYLTFMTISAVTNHSGFEVLPEGAAKHWLGRWIISGVHHAQHHRFFNNNFGLFYTFMDRLCGTENKAYEKDFNKVFSKGKSP